MKHTIEKTFAEPNPDFQENLRLRIDKEFEEYLEIMYPQKGGEESAKTGHIESEKIEKNAEERKKYRKLDFNGRVSELTNNFYFWWPKGFYRELLKEEKKHKSLDAEKIAFCEKLISDLDTIIYKAGYDNIFDLIQKKDTKGKERDERMRAVADVFLKMRDMGYDGDKLRS